jgi:hypothetical protein
MTYQYGCQMWALHAVFHHCRHLLGYLLFNLFGYRFSVY